MSFSFLWYDLETFGLHPQWDRIAQFGALRTNAKFEEISEPVDLYCRLPPDYVPQPEACLVSGITPQDVNSAGLCERDFAARIYAEMTQSGTCTAGFNNLKFDDEFIRALLYRNFYDPYKREYDEGRARWDILNLLRMCRDLRPGGILWPYDEQQQRPVFRLGELTAANGIPHQNAHNALADVRATIAVAKLVHEKQPRLFSYYFGLRKKDQARRMLSLQAMKPVVHSSVMFSSPWGCSSIILPLSVDPQHSNRIIACDLREDPSDWVDLPVQEIRRRVFTSREELGDAQRIPLKGVHVNRSPAIAPLSTLEEERAKALHIDVKACLEHAEILRSRPDLIQKIRAVYADPPRRTPVDVDLKIYSGDFFPDEDRAEFEALRAAGPQSLLAQPPRFYDSRGPEMLWRYIARNFPDSLPEADKQKWRSFCASRILTPEPQGAMDIGGYMREVRNRLGRIDTPAGDKVILKKLLEYGEYLEKMILS
ncbi:MAG: exodeoxyribonuclease I [Spirochaetales bacterium]|jgi:exodeoxyribonuclease-1|nr:exodeoxyribonuclease I [Spirochaetales bacterium]